MTPYKEDIFRELEQVIANAAPEQLEQLLRDIAAGKFDQTAQTRAGSNDDQTNVTDINHRTSQQHVEAPEVCGEFHSLSVASRKLRHAGYSS
jgi:hypothetical protein